MKTNKLVWTTGLSLLLACGGGDDGGDTNAMTVGMTLGGTAGDDGGTAADDGNGSGTAAADDDGGDGAMDTTMGADDAMDDAMDDGAACDPPCAAGEECIAGQCFGGDDDGSTGEPPAECGTNVMLMNPMCDECVKGACCDAMQACFGDETVAAATPCFELNNCVAMNCTMVASAKELQTCAEENCPETVSELNTLLAFLGCSGMNCQAQCAG